MRSVIRRGAQNGSRQVHAFGEMVALLWAQGNHKATIRLEELWDLAHLDRMRQIVASNRRRWRGSSPTFSAR